MKTRQRSRFFAVILAVSVLFGSFSFAATPVSAASAPPKMNLASATATNHKTVCLKWQWNPNVTGYQLFRDGKVVATLGKYTNLHYDTNLAASRSYSYKMRAYKNTKIKQYYNSKKKKWQNKKPKKKYWKKCKKGKYKGKKTRTVNTTLYGAFGSVKTVRTLAKPTDGTWPSVETAKSEALATMNQYLSENGRPEPTWDPEIATVAQRKAEYMANVGAVGGYFPALGGNVMDMMDNAKINFYAANDEYAKNLKTFGQNMINAFDANGGFGGNGVADMVWGNFDRIGIGYSEGYICIIMAY